MDKRTSLDRRTFLKTMMGGVAAWSATAAWLPGRSGPQEAPVRMGNMLYRRLGRTGLQVSEISLGGSPLPDPYLMRAIIDRGVNYVDTSHSYENGNSERQIGRILKEIGRDKLYVGTKFHVRARDTIESIIASVEGSLRRLATDHIDVLMIHGAASAATLVDDRVLEAYERLRKSGAWRFRGLSCHTNHEEVVRKAVDSGLYDMVAVGYNVFDIQGAENEVVTYPDYIGSSGLGGLLDHARSGDVGFVAMKVLKVGGRRQDLDRYRTGSASVYQSMLKWVLDDDRVASALVEILNHREMEEDLGAVGARLTSAEKTTLARFVRDNGRDYCHMCGRCIRACPSGVAVPDILRCLAYHESYGKTRRARDEYAELAAGAKVSSCRDCGSCEAACRYGVSVRARLRTAEALLA